MIPRFGSGQLLALEVVFPTGQDSLVLQDKETDVPSLSRNSKSCHGTGQDGILMAFPVVSGDRTQDRIKRKWIKKRERSNFFAFFYKSCSGFVPGDRSLSRDFCPCPCPGTKGQRDKDFFFVPGQRDNGTSRPLETLFWTNKILFSTAQTCENI